MAEPFLYGPDGKLVAGVEVGGCAGSHPVTGHAANKDDLPVINFVLKNILGYDHIIREHNSLHYEVTFTFRIFLILLWVQ